MLVRACKTDLESQKMINFLLLLALQKRSPETRACNSAEKIEVLSGNRLENSNDGVITAHAVVFPSFEP